MYSPDVPPATGTRAVGAAALGGGGIRAAEPVGAAGLVAGIGAAGLVAGIGAADLVAGIGAADLVAGIGAADLVAGKAEPVDEVLAAIPGTTAPAAFLTAAKAEPTDSARMSAGNFGSGALDELTDDR